MENIKCEKCDYIDIVDWQYNKETEKSTPYYWCEWFNKSCYDVVEKCDKQVGE